MTCNMGKADRVIRGILGVAILGAGLVLQRWWGLIGLIPLATSLVGWCPAYVPFKINTGGKTGG
jgi:hypothetical protein